MHLLVIAVGNKMPGWVASGWEEYARRFPHPWQLELRELPSSRKGRAEENQRLLAAIPANGWPIALDPAGAAWPTERLSEGLARWREDNVQPVFLIGGADGLESETLSACRQSLSLGPLTLPHMLVRIILAEQLYRSWSILNNHPYHRA